MRVALRGYAGFIWEIKIVTRTRILLGKVGLDGHDRGIKYVAHLLRDAGYEVIYSGIRRSPEQIVASAIQEDAQAIGISLLSGAHNALLPRVLDLLREQGAADIPVFAGGTIPGKDIPGLQALGIRAVFTPGTPAKAILATIEQIVKDSIHAPAD